MRGTLVFEIFRLAAERKPRILLLENVAGLLSHDEGRTMATILCGFWELGYDVQWQVLNSKDFGVPQNRERIFFVGHLGTGSGRKVFPIGGENENIINQIGSLNLPGRHESAQRIYGVDGVAPCLNTCGGGGLETKIAIPVLTPDRAEKRQNGRRFKEDGEPMFTLTGQDRHGVAINCINPRKGDGTQSYQQDRVYDESGILPALNAELSGRNNISQGMRIRKLTPRECFRLQGFPDWAFDRVKAAGVSDSQLYKQAGNSVTTTVVYEIAKLLK